MGVCRVHTGLGIFYNRIILWYSICIPNMFYTCRKYFLFDSIIVNVTNAIKIQTLHSCYSSKINNSINT
jgi:hypothetical protein